MQLCLQSQALNAQLYQLQALGTIITLKAARYLSNSNSSILITPCIMQFSIQ